MPRRAPHALMRVSFATVCAVLLALLVCVGLLLHEPFHGSDSHQSVPVAETVTESLNSGAAAASAAILPDFSTNPSSADTALRASAICVFLLTIAATLAIRRMGGPELKFLSSFREVAASHLPELSGTALPLLVPLRI